MLSISACHPQAKIYQTNASRRGDAGIRAIVVRSSLDDTDNF